MRPKYNLNDLLLAGLGVDYFIKPEHVNAKGGAEDYLPSLGEHILIPPECINAKGGAEDYIPGLGKYFYVNPAHIDQAALAVVLGQSAPSGGTVTITATIAGGVAPYVTKYLAGIKTTADFASAGTAFTGTFGVTVIGDYTVYCVDAIGNETVATINVASVA